MTNNEYEKLSVEAANGQSRVKFLDRKIEEAERCVDRLREIRRELVNRYNLAGKNIICPNNLNGSDSHYCPKCGGK